jgi:dihydrofolate synthase/folylpolyglutamate synthase
MTRKSLSEWLAWQESLNPKEIDLGLDRVRAVALQLELRPPIGRVFVVAGTNGKGSCATILEALLRASDLSTGLYTSPHLVRYNERIRINNVQVDDATLVETFEQIEAVRGDTPLTYFEFGTLAALLLFSSRVCDAWILEVGLGGRLDATNMVDADVAIITVVDLDHQDWLGDTVEKIAAEKAGIMRPGKPAFYGSEPVPASIRVHAQEIGALLGCHGESYSIETNPTEWCWQGCEVTLQGLPWPPGRAAEQLRNQAVALAALEACDPAVLSEPARVRSVLDGLQLPGRFQEYSDDHQWVLDVAHNPQAAAAMRARLVRLEPLPTTVVVGMMADKQTELYARELAGIADLWIACPVDTARGSTADELADRLRSVLQEPVETAGSVTAGLSRAREQTPLGGRIVVSGSFLVVGPALEWLGLY